MGHWSLVRSRYIGESLLLRGSGILTMPLLSGEVSDSIFWRVEKSKRNNVVSVFKILVKEWHWKNLPWL